MLDVGRPEDIDLPVFRASDAPAALLSTGCLALSLGLRDRVQVTKAYFSLLGISCVSAPRYASDVDYYAPMQRDPQGGDWRLDNFLRESLEDQPGETAESWESRVADLWEIVGDDESWVDLDLNVDGHQVAGRSFAWGGKAFVRVLLPDCDLEIRVPSTRVGRLPGFQRMTIQELEQVFGEWRQQHQRRSS